jgi:hypothetical protein
VRLRVLSETECYTRCYGDRRSDRVSLVKVVPRGERREGTELQKLVRERGQAA